MNHQIRPRLSFLFCLALIVSIFAANAYGQKSRRAKGKQTALQTTDDSVPESQVQLKLNDGTRITVEDAWESQQGIWYRQGGMTHLVSRERVKGIVRGTASPTKVEKQVATVTDIAQTPDKIVEAVWIHLKGGARVEADSASESAAGVWYQRGPLSIFIERSRIDHIERETLGAVAEADGKRPRGWSTGRPKLDALIRHNGAKFGVDPYLIFCVMEQESHFNARALSPKGAMGLMQLMPGTAARFGVRHAYDPAQNIAGGTRYLKQLLGRFNNRVDLVLASYNAGEGAVARFGNRVPPYRETRNYVKRISYRLRQVKSPVKSPANSSRNAASAGGY
jgi:Zn-finger nucleic acid-binding protein